MPRLVSSSKELVRFSYAHVFKAKSSPNGGDPKFSVAILIPKKNKRTVMKVRAAIDAALAEGKKKYGPDWYKKAKNKTPLRDGDTDDSIKARDKEIYGGNFYFNASSSDRPQILDEDMQEIDDANDFYSGCWGRFSVNFYPYDNVSKGVGAGLNNLMKLKDGEKLSGGASAEEDFADDDFDDDFSNDGFDDEDEDDLL